MGRPVAFRAAAILGYPGEVQPSHFRMKRHKMKSGASAQTSHQMGGNYGSRRCFPYTQSCKHFPGRGMVPTHL